MCRTRRTSRGLNRVPSGSATCRASLVTTGRRPIAALTAIDMTAAEHDLLAAARCSPASLTVAIADTLTKVVEAAEDQEDAP